MNIEYNKFLAITAALATAAAAATGCVTEDNTDDTATGGSAGSGGSDTGGNAGTGGAMAGSGGQQTGGDAGQAGAEAGGAAGAVTAGAAGTATAGAAGEAAGGVAGEVVAGGAAGQAPGGAGGMSAGGAGGGGEAQCLGDTPEASNDCTTGYPDTDCWLEDPNSVDPAWEGVLNYPADACDMATYRMLRGGVFEGLSACLQEIADPCTAEAATAAQACADAAYAAACESEIAVDACANGYTDIGEIDHPAILTACDDGTLAQDACVAGLGPFADPYVVSSCMDPQDPSGEYYDPLFNGDCAARFQACLDIAL